MRSVGRYPKGKQTFVTTSECSRWSLYVVPAKCILFLVTVRRATFMKGRMCISVAAPHHSFIGLKFCNL